MWDHNNTPPFEEPTSSLVTAMLVTLDCQTLSNAMRFLMVETLEKKATIDLDTQYTQEYLAECVGSETRRAVLYQVRILKYRNDNDNHHRTHFSQLAMTPTNRPTVKWCSLAIQSHVIKCSRCSTFFLRVTWMGGFHLFSDVAKYGRTNNKLEERSRDSKPNEGMNTQPVRDNANVFQSFNSYAKAVLGNKSVGVSGNNDASNSVEKPVGVSVSNKENEESSNEALMFISEDDGMERSILAKVKDLSVITDLLKYMSSEGFVDVGLRYVGGRWVWLEFDSTDQVESVKNSKVPEVYKKLGCQWGCSMFTDMVNDGPLSHRKVCVLTESLHCVLESFKVSYRNRSYCITATEFAYWAPNIESMNDKSMTDSLERKDDEGPSLDRGPKHEEPLDIDNYDSVSSKDDNNDSDSSSEIN
nr:RNA-directed DNA polymerase, eukaryota [Tanacetum cinerariifolium]